MNMKQENVHLAKEKKSLFVDYFDVSSSLHSSFVTNDVRG